MSVTVDSEMPSNAAVNSGSASSLTFNFTNTAGTAIYVTTDITSSTATVGLTSITYGGDTCSAVVNEDWDTHAGASRSQIWTRVKISPKTGSQSVVITATSTFNDILGACISVKGDSGLTANALGTFDDSGSVNSPTLSPTNVATGSLVLTVYGHGGAIGSSYTLSAGQVDSAQLDVDSGTGGNNLLLTRTANTGNLSLNLTAATTSDLWGMVCMEILAGVIISGSAPGDDDGDSFQMRQAA